MIADEFKIRAILPEDKEGLKEGLALLSAESRRQRFFSSRKDFTEKELTFFTEVDQINHLALVAINKGAGPSPAGTIRCIRDNTRPEYAELAITIVDIFQGRGLGTELMEQLAKAAQLQNIKFFYGDFHTSNIRMLKLLEKYRVKHQIPAEKFHLTHKSDGFLYFEMALA